MLFYTWFLTLGKLILTHVSFSSYLDSNCLLFLLTRVELGLTLGDYTLFRPTKTSVFPSLSLASLFHFRSPPPHQHRIAFPPSRFILYSWLRKIIIRYSTFLQQLALYKFHTRFAFRISRKLPFNRGALVKDVYGRRNHRCGCPKVSWDRAVDTTGWEAHRKGG